MSYHFRLTFKWDCEDCSSERVLGLSLPRAMPMLAGLVSTDGASFRHCDLDNKGAATAMVVTMVIGTAVVTR
jgi:hypothetical protein